MPERASKATLEEFVFHSNWIEGYDPEVYDHNSTLFKNHLRAAMHVADNLEWDPQLLHVMLLEGAAFLPPHQVGTFRTTQVRVGGFYPPEPGPHLLRHVARWKAMVVEGPREDEEAEQWCWRMHHEFECVHPFVDGNGRVGRLVLNALRLRYGLPWYTVHHGDEQQRYYGFIRAYQRSEEWRCSKEQPSTGVASVAALAEALYSWEKGKK